MSYGLVRQSMFTVNVRLTKGGKEWYSFLNRFSRLREYMKNKLRLLWWKIKRQPFVTIAIVAINALVFLLCKISPMFYAMGDCGVYNVLYDKEYARVIWSMFFHSDAYHIFNNMIIVVFLGSILESQVGHLLYGLVYFVAGIGGNIFSLIVKCYHQDWSVSIGASGAVFGLDGLLLAMALLLWDRIDIPVGRVILVVFLSVYSGFSNPGIDNAAHVGGLLVGFLVGIPICLYQRRKHR